MISKKRVDGLNPVDDTVEEMLVLAKNFETDEVVGSAAIALAQTIDTLLRDGKIQVDDAVSESCNANPALGANVARFQKARMDAAA